MPPNKEDEIALGFIEKAVFKAQKTLVEFSAFRPFSMLLTDSGKIEIYENELDNIGDSYALLEEEIAQRIKKNDISILILAVDTEIPENFSKGIPMSIRIHLEEKSQIGKIIGARFLYVPYELCQTLSREKFVRLHAPIAVGFPSEYLK